MQESTFDELENLFLALSDKTRLRLLALMADGEVSVGFLAGKLNESQPKISRHLAYLRNAGLVSARRDGKWIYYNIERPADLAVARVLTATINSIAAVRVDGQTIFFTDTEPQTEVFYAEADNIYAEPYESDYQPNEIEIYLL